MRVLLIVHQFLPRHVTGTEQYVRSIARGLKARGHEPVVFAFEPLLNHEKKGLLWFERDDAVDGILVRRVGLHPEECGGPVLGDYENPIAGRLLEKLLDERPFAVTHLFHPRHTGLAAIREPQRRGIPVVVNLMDFWFLCPNFMLLRRGGELCDGPPNGGLGCVECLDPVLGKVLDRSGAEKELVALARSAGRTPSIAQRPLSRALALMRRKERTFAALARAEAILAPSLFLRGKFTAAGFPEERLEHVPYGVDRERLDGFAKREPRAGELAIGYVGSITAHKGLHVLLSAVRGIKSPLVSVDVHGSLDTHAEYSARVTKIAGNDRRIRFRGPFEPHELGRVLSHFDVLVVPSLWYENTPFTMLEALAAGLPVVASDLGGISEVVVPERNGWLFPAGDERALRLVLERITEPSARSLTGGTAPRTLDDNLDELERIYARVRKVEST